MIAVQRLVALWINSGFSYSNYLNPQNFDLFWSKLRTNLNALVFPWFQQIYAVSKHDKGSKYKDNFPKYRHF